MARYDESVPILYGRDASGELHNVDDVANGEACGCFCPDPNCGQPLVARNGGTKRVHHFAHKKGTCTWSAEYVIAELACMVVTECGRMAFPELDYDDCLSDETRVLASQQTLPVDEAVLDGISERRAPELLVSIGNRKFVVVLSLIHELEDDYVGQIREKGYKDIVHINLGAILKGRKDEEGKHFDREFILAGFQDKEFIKRVMLGEDAPCKRWASNEKRDRRERESREALDKKTEEERKRAAARTVEAEKRVEFYAQFEHEFLYGPKAVDCPRTGRKAPIHRCDGSDGKSGRCGYCVSTMADGIVCCYKGVSRGQPISD